MYTLIQNSRKRTLCHQHCFKVNQEILTWRSKQDIILSNLLIITRNIFTNQQISEMAVATKIQLPYQEDTGLDGKKIYTPIEWTKRFRQYMKRIYKIDIKPILTDDTVPTGDPWDSKEVEIRQDFIWGAGPSAIEIITKREFNTDPDTIKTDKLIQLFREYYMSKRNTYHSRGDFFWAKQEDNETSEEHWKKLITLEKNVRIQKHQVRRPTHIEIYHKHNRQKRSVKTDP